MATTGPALQSSIFTRHSTYNDIHHVEPPSLGSKTSNKKVCSLAPFKTTLYSSRCGVSPSRFHVIINSHWGIHCPSLNSLASLLAIYTSVYKWRLLLELHQYLQTHKLACNMTYHRVSHWSDLPSLLSVDAFFWNVESDLTLLKNNLQWCVQLCKMTEVLLHSLHVVKQHKCSNLITKDLVYKFTWNHTC